MSTILVHHFLNPAAQVKAALKQYFTQGIPDYVTPIPAVLPNVPVYDDRQLEELDSEGPDIVIDEYDASRLGWKERRPGQIVCIGVHLTQPANDPQAERREEDLAILLGAKFEGETFDELTGGSHPLTARLNHIGHAFPTNKLHVWDCIVASPQRITGDSQSGPILTVSTNIEVVCGITHPIT